MPDEIARFLDDISLHDATLRSLDVDVVARRLDMQLNGFKYVPPGVEGCRRSISLSYLRLRGVTTTDDPTRSLPGPDGFGDLGYDEFELMADGSFEHRMIFSSGIEIQIRFEEMRFSCEDQK
jgi:hypothetical protein